MDWLPIKSDPLPPEILIAKSTEMAIYIFEFLFLIKAYVISTAGNKDFYI